MIWIKDKLIDWSYRWDQYREDAGSWYTFYWHLRAWISTFPERRKCPFCGKRVWQPGGAHQDYPCADCDKNDFPF